jgi:homoaconitase/3-isopropylmalate dehydratase large subunit
MHQINLECMSPVIHSHDGVAFPETLVGTDSHTPHVNVLGVIAGGVGDIEAKNIMPGLASLTDKKSNHTRRSTESFSRLNLTAFASIRNAVCAKNST